MLMLLHELLVVSQPVLHSLLMQVVVIGAVAALFLRRGQSLHDSLVGAANMSMYILGCALVMRPGSSRAAHLTYLCLRVLFSALLFFLPIHSYKAYSHNARNALVWTVFSVSALITQVIARRVLPMWACHVLGVLHGLATTCISLHYLLGGETWCYYLTILLAPQLCAFGPITAVEHAWRVWQRKRCAARPACAQTQCAAPSAAGQPQHPSSWPSEQPSSRSASCGSATASMTSELPAPAAAGAGVNSTDSTLPARTVSHVDGGHDAMHRSRVLSGGSRGAHVHEMLRLMQTGAYTSKLGSQYKVCLKLATDLPHTSLPPDMAQHMQDALNAIGGVSLHVCELAVRAGCIMIAMTLRDCATAPRVAGTAANSSSSEGNSQSSSRMLQLLGPAMLARAQQVLLRSQATAASSCMEAAGKGAGPAPHQGAAEEVPPGMPQLMVEEAMLQWDEQLAVATRAGGDGRSPHTWQLQEVSSGPAAGAAPAAAAAVMGAGLPGEADGTQASAPSPWLGVAVAAGTCAKAGVGSHAAGTANVVDAAVDGVEVAVEVQVWGVSKVEELEGWQPLPAGQHCPSHATTACSSSGGSRSSSAAASKGFKLLARNTSGYLATQVMRCSYAPGGPGCTTAQILVHVPASSLTVHHSGGPPSQLLLLSMELWVGEVLRSTTPLLAATAPDTSPAVMSGMYGWWWGASNPAVQAAIAEVQGVSQALAAAGQEVCEVLPSHLLFLEDLQQWLAGVRAMAVSRGVCTSSNPALKPTLPLAALQALGAGLLEHAQVVGMKGVYAMVSQQMQLVGKTRKSPAWLQGVTDVLLGYPCQLCEDQYKAQLAAHLGPMQALSSAAFAVYAAMGCVSVVRSGDKPCLLLMVPWLLLHAAGSAASICVGMQRGARAASAPHASASAYVNTLRWTRAAYMWRLVSLACYAANVMRAPLVAGRLFLSYFPWAATHLMFALVEQMQASAVLPAWLVCGLALCVDLPSVLVRVLRGSNSPAGWAAALLLAPAVVVASRLLLDARMRHTLKHRKCPQARPASSGKRTSAAHGL